MIRKLLQAGMNVARPRQLYRFAKPFFAFLPAVVAAPGQPVVRNKFEEDWAIARTMWEVLGKD